MPQVFCTVNQPAYKTISKIADDEQKTISKVVLELVELGLKVKSLNDGSGENNEEKLWNDLFKDQVKATFAILETSREILRMTHTPTKSHFKNSVSADTVIDSIKTKVTNYVEGRLKKEV